MSWLTKFLTNEATFHHSISYYGSYMHGSLLIDHGYVDALVSKILIYSKQKVTYIVAKS